MGGGYIQPGSVGGAPGAPQGLNRYASDVNSPIPAPTLSSRANDRHAIATSVNHGVLTVNWGLQQAVGQGVSLGARNLSQYSLLRFSVSASRQKLLTRLPQEAIELLGGRSIVEGLAANRSIHTLSTGGFRWVRGQALGRSAFDDFLRVIPGDARSTRWAGRLGDDFFGHSLSWLGSRWFGAASAGAGDSLIQLFWPGSGDYWTYQEKGLTSGQVAGRATVSAVGGVAAFGFAEVTVAIVVAVAAPTILPAEVLVGIGIGVFIGAEYLIESQKPALFEWLDLRGVNE